MSSARSRLYFGAVALSVLACQAFASNEGEEQSGGGFSPPFPSQGRAPTPAPSFPGRAGDPTNMAGNAGSAGGGGTGGSGTGGSSAGVTGNRSGAGPGGSAASDASAGDTDVPDALIEPDAALE